MYTIKKVTYTYNIDSRSIQCAPQAVVAVKLSVKNENAECQ
jgi:hypothetical protein